MLPDGSLLPRSAPSAAGVSARAVRALLDRLEEGPGEMHSLMVVRRGSVVAEGWWAPYTADRPHLLYSLTKSFTAMAVGLAVADGVLSLEDRVVDVLPEHVPDDASEQARRLTVDHLLTMTTGHAANSLLDAWELEPGDLTKGFLRVPFTDPEGTHHFYDDATTYVLARMVERATGRDLPDLLDERIFAPMGIDHAEWDRVGSGAVFGFHGLHLTTEAVAAFGELLLRGGRWGDRQLVPRDWVERATTRRVDSTSTRDDGTDAGADFQCGYGYQVWMSRHGFHGNGAYGQQCVVVPEADLVVVVTQQGDSQPVFDALWECLLPGIDGDDAGEAESGADDAALAERLRGLALPPVAGLNDAGRSTAARLDGTVEGSALPDGTSVTVKPAADGWVLRLGDEAAVKVGSGAWRESAPLGRPVVASGAWVAGRFVADLCVITTPHRVRVTIDDAAGAATATWSTPPLTTTDLTRHLRAPLMTRPDVA